MESIFQVAGEALEPLNMKLELKPLFMTLDTFQIGLQTPRWCVGHLVLQEGIT